MTTAIAAAATWPPFPKPITLAALAADLTPKQSEAVKHWVLLTQVLAILAGAIRAVDTVIDDKISDPKKQKVVDASLHSAYAVLQSADQAVKEEITAIKTGKMPDHPLPPITIPPWNPSDKPESVFKAVWQSLEPALEAAYELWGHNSKLGLVFYSLITAGTNVVKILDYYFPNDT